MLPWPKGNPIYSPEVWANVLSRLRAGETPTEIGSIDGMPTDQMIYSRIRTKREFELAYTRRIDRVAKRKRLRARAAAQALNQKAWKKRARSGLIAPEDDKGRYKGGWRFDQKTADRIIAKLADGFPITAFAGKNGFPSKSDIYDRRRYDPAFAARTEKAAPERFKRRKKRKSTSCRPHDQAVWDEVARLLNVGHSLSQIGKMEGLPSAAVISSKRRADPDFAARVPPPKHRWGKDPKPADWDAVLSHLRGGLSIEQVGQLPGVPSPHRIRRKIERDPAFASVARQCQIISNASRPEPLSKSESMKAWRAQKGLVKPQPPLSVAYLTADNLKKLMETNGWSQATLGQHIGATQHQISRWCAGRGVKPETAGRVGPRIAELLGLAGPETTAKRLNADRIYAAANKAVPRRLADDVRLEVIANIVMAVYDGTLAAEDVPKKAGQYLTAFLRENQDLRQSSLDKVVGNDGQSFGDRLGVF